MKVKFRMVVEMIKEVSQGRHAETMEDEIEQELAELQEDSAAQHSLLDSADIVSITGEKLIVR